MKLLRFKLDVPFRSLPAGFEVHFLRPWDYEQGAAFHPYCLVGRNGSGKSNVLEALAAIFYHIECIYLNDRPDGFEYNEETNPKGFRAEVSNPDAFDLEYVFPIELREPLDEPLSLETIIGGRPVAHIRIRKTLGARPEIYWLNRADYGQDGSTLLSRNEVKEFLPKYIVGYSSGHNEILSLPFFKMRFINFDEYRKILATDDSYSGKPEGRMIYVDEQFSQAILICHFLFPSEAVTKVFEEKVGLKGISRFRIIIRRHHRIPVATVRFQTMSLEDRDDPMKTTVEFTSKLSGDHDDLNPSQRGLIEKLIKCSTTHYEDFSAYSDGESYDLYLDYWVNDATKQAFLVHFGEASGVSADVDKARSALNLFQAFQILLTLNYYKVDEITKTELYQSDSLYVNETIPVLASHERIIRFKEGELMKENVTGKLYVKALSDGEHQLLHTIGLCLLYRHESALFLLDEPETHLNPDWRASYISTLRAALKADAKPNEVMREVLLTSHSPFIISDCRKENVLIFNKASETQNVTWSRPDFETFGASANAITIKIFGRTETIGDHAMQKITDLHSRLDAGEEPAALIKEAGRELGDSVEKVLFINQAINKSEDK